MRVNEGAVSVARFAERIHALAGGTHHVASPLGAWMLLALSASAGGDPPTPLEEVLGGAPNEAIELTCRLLADPHPLVACALALWERDPTNEALLRWKKGLPPQVETGVIPSKAELDEWAERHTLGIIKEFPGEIKPWMTVLMASALATKVTWREPFDIVPASELGSSSRWSDQVQWVLRTPEMSSHRQFIADTERAGRVAVHVADAEGGLAVLSVIASEDVPAVDVIAAAYQVAGGEEGRSAGSGFSGRSLFDLPLGETPSWTISEEAVETTDPEGREERYLDTTLPAWSAETELNLRGAAVGFEQVANAMQGPLGLDTVEFDARQVSKARYTARGFYAASITSIAFGSARLPRLRRGVRRTARLRFGHSYAVVAVSQAPHGGISLWNQLPVFSAWITEPEDATIDTEDVDGA